MFGSDTVDVLVISLLLALMKLFSFDAILTPLALLFNYKKFYVSFENAENGDSIFLNLS
jgi:hypothetical protein